MLAAITQEPILILVLGSLAFVIFNAVAVRYRALSILRKSASFQATANYRQLQTAINMLTGAELYSKSLKKEISYSQIYLKDIEKIPGAKEQLQKISDFIEEHVQPKVASSIDGALVSILAAGKSKSSEQTVYQFVANEFRLDVALKSGRAFIELGLPRWFQDAQGIIPKLAKIARGESDLTVREVIMDSFEKLKAELSEIATAIAEACSPADSMLANLASTEQITSLSEELALNSLITDAPTLMLQMPSSLSGTTLMKHAMGTADDHARVPFASYADDIVISMGDDAAKGAAAGLADDVIVASTDDVASSVLGAGLAGIPVLTLLGSSIREIRILSDNKTTLEDAFANIMLDAAGTGGGGLAGFAIGNLFFPGVGGIVGGIIGALGGRSASNKLKRLDYEEAMKRYKAAFRQATEAQDEAATSYHRRMSRAIQRARKHRQQVLMDFPEISSLDKAICLLAVRLNVFLHDQVNVVQKNLSRAAIEAKEMARNPGFLSRLGGLNEERMKRLISHEHRHLHQELTSFRKSLTSKDDAEHNPKKFLHFVAGLETLPLENDKGIRLTAQGLLSLVEVQTAILIAWAHAVSISERQGAVSVMQTANKGLNIFKSETETHVQAVKITEQKVEIQKGKLGMK